MAYFWPGFSFHCIIVILRLLSSFDFDEDYFDHVSPCTPSKRAGTGVDSRMQKKQREHSWPHSLTNRESLAVIH